VIDCVILRQIWGDAIGIHAEKETKLAAVPRVGETVMFDLTEESCSIDTGEVECVQWQENGPVWIHLEDSGLYQTPEECLNEYTKFGWHVHIIKKSNHSE